MAFTSMPCARRAPTFHELGRSRAFRRERQRTGGVRRMIQASPRATSEKAKAVAEFQLVVLIPGIGTRFPARGAMNEQQACFDGVTWSDHVEHPTSCRGHYERPDHGGRSSELLLFRWGGLFSRCEYL